LLQQLAPAPVAEVNRLHGLHRFEPDDPSDT
jgi:hypothetical protein